MKKILALVLALVMTMSLVTISSGAAFTDADSVQYTDAVNTLNALGVLNGYADGSIVPQGDVTRGAAAKMVAMVASGSNAATLGYYKGTSSFADVPASHTFADAVSFCVARGIVAGYGDGNYGVGDNVKGWAIAKMVLVAMGYDAKAFGMEGAGSALNTITLATQAHLFDGMNADFVATEAASREECAQIVYNALTQKMKEATSNTNTGVVSYDTVNKTLLNNYASLGYADGNAVIAAAAGKGAFNALVNNANSCYVITANKATAHTNYTKVGATLFDAETGLDMIGHKVLMVKSGTGKDAVEGTYNKVFNVVDLSKEVTLYEDITNNLTKFQAAFGMEAINNPVTVADFENYSAASLTPTCDSTNGSATAGTYVLAPSATGYDVVSYLTSDFNVGYVSAYSAGTTAKNGTVTITGDFVYDPLTFTYSQGTLTEALITKTGDYTPTNITLYDGIAVGDIVVVEKTGAKYTVSKAATATAKVSSVDAASTINTLVAGGDTYSKSWHYVGTTNALVGLNSTIAWTGAAMVNNTVKMYLDNTGSVFAAEIVSGDVEAGVVYVVDTYSKTVATTYGDEVKYYAQCLTLAGEEAIYEISSTTYNSGSCAAEGTIVKVTLDSYNVASFGSANTATNYAVNNDTVAAGGVLATSKTLKAGHYYASDVKFVYVDTTAGAMDKLVVTVKDGAQALADTETIRYYETLGADGNYTVKYIFVAGQVPAAQSTDLVFVAKSAVSAKAVTYVDATGNETVGYLQPVYINGEAKEIMMVNSNALNVGFYTYSVASTGVYTLSGYSTNCSTAEEVVMNVYGNLVTTKLAPAGTSAGSFLDMDASAAKIIDADYAAMTADQKAATAEITTLAELISTSTAGAAKNANVWVAYTVNNNVASASYIYIVDQTDNT